MKHHLMLSFTTGSFTPAAAAFMKDQGFSEASSASASSSCWLLQWPEPQVRLRPPVQLHKFVSLKGRCCGPQPFNSR